MKKIGLLFLSLMMCFCSMFMLTGCGGDECCGEWKLSYIEFGEQTFQLGDQLTGIELTADSIKIEINKDGKAYMRIVSTFNPDKYNESVFTWKREAEIITFTSTEDDESNNIMEGYYTGDQLRIDLYGEDEKGQPMTTSTYLVRA